MRSMPWSSALRIGCFIDSAAHIFVSDWKQTGRVRSYPGYIIVLSSLLAWPLKLLVIRHSPTQGPTSFGETDRFERGTLFLKLTIFNRFRLPVIRLKMESKGCTIYWKFAVFLLVSIRQFSFGWRSEGFVVADLSMPDKLNSQKAIRTVLLLTPWWQWPFLFCHGFPSHRHTLVC